ncbi:MAG: mechanosensitive ion channel family protein [Burkholderiales bacterium]
MNFNVMLEPIRAILTQVGVFLPKLGLAVVVLLVGWGLARLARFTVARGLRAINFNVLTERAGVDGFLRQGGIKSDTTDIFAVLVYWLVVFIALVIAFNGLGLSYITDLLGQVVLFVPKVIVALLILAFGAYFALFVAGTVSTYCANIGLKDGELLGKIAQYAILAFVVLIALDQMSIGGDIVRHSFLILLGGVVLGLALAFGIGGQKWAAGLLERWWPRGGD